MIIMVDIDGTICTEEKGEYEKTKPVYENINKINKLYDEGHTIIYWTARGTVTKIDWYELTKKQLNDWGCKYHDLQVGNKPHFDMYICDKSWNSESFFHYRERRLP